MHDNDCIHLHPGESSNIYGPSELDLTPNSIFVNGPFSETDHSHVYTCMYVRVSI